MGRNKISIQKIKDEKIRKVTYCKRKKGILKKVMELSLLCDVEIFLGICPKQVTNNKLFIFSTTTNIDYFYDKYINNPLLKKEIYGLKDVSHIFCNF